MTTIYAVYNSDGCLGRCDAKCHEAKGEECHCICGGVMHGVGSKIALEDRKYLTDEDILENVQDRNVDGSLRVLCPVQQLELFG